MTTLSERIQLAMQATCISQADLARLCDVKAPSVHGWLSGKSKFLRGENLLKAAVALKVSPDWLATGSGEMHRIDQNNGTQLSREGSNLEEAPALRPFRDVPVVGTVQAGDSGFFVELEYPVGHGDGSITYPAKDTNSYALRVKGDSMRPRIKNGEFIVVEPGHVPQPGDDVVVVLTDGRKMVKELLYARDGEVTLGSINNGHGNITVATELIEKMHYVAAIIPRGAFYKSNQ